jgi:tRNA-modifying protein YgfZ
MELPAELNTELNAVMGPRDTVVVEGPDALTYLHSQVSQDLRDQAVGEQRWTFVLQPTGKIDALARVTRSDDERFELDVNAGFGEGLLARINRFKIRVKADATLIVGDVSELDSDTERTRIVLGWPRMGSEIIPGETIPASTGLNGIAVCFTKGCYPGQELVERMDSRAAEAPKSLRRLTVAAGAAIGDPVLDGDDIVGELTSVSGTAALGWVKRSSDVGEPVAF